MTFILILLGKIINSVSKILNIGSGSTWPGHIALEIDKDFIMKILNQNKKLKIILIAGTNGKTTTGKLIQSILEENQYEVFQNDAGANLLNGIASSLIKNINLFGKIRFDYAVFEVDENSLPLVLQNVTPRFLILLNLFRDQLDRYGEVNIIANNWKKVLQKNKSILILNADDPKIAFLRKDKNTRYFGVEDINKQTIDHASDSTYCPECENKLTYKYIIFSHLGDWSCNRCGLKKPILDIKKIDSYPLPGLYNKYNLHAAVLTSRLLGIPENIINNAIKKFKPAFGRQEKINYKGKKIQIFLSKNPTSFNQSLQTINELKAKHVLIILNDRIPDGRDVSWIWDVDTEKYIHKTQKISVTGDRGYDMALRLKYGSINNFNIYADLNDAVNKEIASLSLSDILYILPTYSAMLDIRKILTGKAIL